MRAGQAVFAVAGYPGASSHAIIERAEIARGTFYLYVESKSSVFSSILDQAMSDLRARIKRIEVDDPKAAPPTLGLVETRIAALSAPVLNVCEPRINV